MTMLQHPAPRRVDQDDVPGATRFILEAQVERKIDTEKREATFVAATEGGVMGYSGRQYLRMAGVQLKRYRKNPVVLDTHDRFQASSIVGRVTDISVEDRKLIVVVQFAKTARAEEIWQLVVGGFLRTVSVGFMPDTSTMVELPEGQSDGSGDSKIDGPARIFRKWELLEISVVPIPADPDAVRRSIYLEDKGEQLMSSAQNPAPATPPAPAPAAPPAPAPVQTPAPAPAQAAQGNEIACERSMREEKARIEHIRLITPKGMEAFSEGLITQNLGVEDARKKISEEYARTHAPVGTPAPAPVVKTGEAAPVAGQQPAQTGSVAPAQTQAAPDDGLLVRSLCGPRIF